MMMLCNNKIGNIVLLPFVAIMALVEAISPAIRDRRNAKKAGVSLEEYRSNRMYYLLKSGKRG